MASFQLCLPQMMMSIYKSRGDDLVGTVDDFCTVVWVYVLSDPRDFVVFDEQRVSPQRHDMAVRLVRGHKDGCILE